MSSLELRSFVDDEIKRNHHGHMLVVPPAGGAPVGYTRVTTVAKALDDEGALGPWKSTMAIVGLLARSGLRSKWETLLAATAGDPWYGGGKADARKLVEECSKAGGALDRAERGTALHALTALVDVGRNVAGLQPETEADVTAYVNKLIEEGITIATSPAGNPYVEVSVALDAPKVAGTADRIVNVPGFDKPMIADLKTGTELSYSWRSIAVQLAAYAHADCEYVQGAAEDGSADERLPLPDLDREHGLVIHLPAGTGRCYLYVVDLAAGWEGFQLSMVVRAWRKRRDLSVTLPKLAARPASIAAKLAERAAVEALPEGTKLGRFGRPTTEQLADAAVNGLQKREPKLRLVAETTPEERAREAHPSKERPPSGPRTSDDLLPLRTWLQARIDVVGQHSPEARADLAASWPAGVPPLKRSDAHTAAQLAEIESVLDDVERRHTVPFGPSRPGSAAIAPADWLLRLGAEFPNTTIHTTGDNE